jgi:hypothetical protein
MFGKQVYATHGNANKQYKFGDKFMSGLYMVQVQQGSDIRTLKLVKVR